MMHVVRQVLAIVAATGLLAGPALADVAKIQVLQAEGRADAKARAKIDAAILKLAKSGGDQIVPGDITFGDAAAAVGCRSEDAACKDEVIGMLSVDEIVITTVTPKPGGLEVAVRRVAKGGASRDAVALVANDKVDQLDAIAPLFRPTTATPVSPSPNVSTAPGPMSEPGAVATPTAPPSLTAEPPSSPIVTAPVDDPRPSSGRRLQMVGMAGGTTLVLVGLVLWGSAASVQSEIDDAPTGTRAEIAALRDLEDKGDTYASAGNLLVLGGLVLGGVSTYYFIKGNRSRAQTARIVPAVFDHGGGIAFQIGGAP